MRKLFFISTLLLLSFFNCYSNVSLPSIFGDHMVLQQKSEVKIWGWADALEELTISTSWDTTKIHTIGSNQGKWAIKLQIPAADNQSHSITIQGWNTIEIKNILFGEVWLCSGQSNMQWSPSHKINDADSILNMANQPNIRLYHVPHITALHPQIDINSNWQISSTEAVKHFSAVAFLFGNKLHEILNVPIGLVHSSWGGTPAESWINEEYLSQDSVLVKQATKINDMPWCPKEPGRTYNSMIAPLVPFQFAGVIWYQGETNTSNASTYCRLLNRLISNWREEFKKELPFYLVQIAPFEDYYGYTGVTVRDQQRRVLETPKTGMVVISDIGDTTNIHPMNKIDVGYRLANLALAKTYSFDIPASSPLYKSMEIKGKSIELTFENTYGKLISRNGKPTHFTIAGGDKVFYPAKAKIVGEKILISSKKVKQPVAARFAWTNTAEPNLFNKEGLPASCFKTDDWE